MGRKMNFFLSVLLVLLFGMGLSTFSLANSGELNYRDDPASELNEYTLKSVFDYYISIQNTFGKRYPMTNQISLFYENVDWNSFLNKIHETFKDTDVECQHLVFAVEKGDPNAQNTTYFNLSVWGNNNTTGNLPFTRFYLGSNDWVYYEVAAKQFEVIFNDDGTTTYQDLENFTGAYFNCYTNGSTYKYSLNNKQYITNSSKKIVQVAGTQTADFGGILPLSPTASFYTITSDDKTNYQWLMATNYINLPSSTEIPDIPDEPEEPSGDEGGGNTGGNTGNITNPSGDTTGKVDLSGIESGIGNINQNIDKTNEKLDGISGEIGKLNENLTTVPDISDKTITSEDITGSFDFEFAEDPYANFWLELTTGLSGALTNNVRSIDVQFRNKTYKIELDKFAIQTPEFLKSFLAILSTVFIFWKMVKYWKIIIDNITSGNMDEVLEMNEEERNY